MLGIEVARAFRARDGQSPFLSSLLGLISTHAHTRRSAREVTGSILQFSERLARSVNVVQPPAAAGRLRRRRLTSSANVRRHHFT
jgi:hypothetical protein